MAYGQDKNKMGKKNLVKPPTNRVGTASKKKGLNSDLEGALKNGRKAIMRLKAQEMEKKDVRSAKAKAGASMPASKRKKPSQAWLDTKAKKRARGK